MISKRAEEIKPSVTLSINQMAKMLISQGKDVVNLSVGEPDFDTPQPIKEFAKKVIDDGFTKYTEDKGIKELREVISEKLLKENNLKYTPEQIVVSNGAKHSLFNIFLTILNPDDEVIIPSPYWVSYPAMVKIAGGVPVFCKWNDKFKIDIDDLKQKITPRTKGIILNTPSNPTGIVYTKEELIEIAEVLVRNNIICISDEVYEKIIYDKIHISIAEMSDEMKKLTIVVNGVSKTFAMTGWRIGYIAGEKEIVNAISKIQSQTTSAPSSISQKAAYFAIKEGEDLYKNMVEEFKKRRDFLVKNLSKRISFPYPDGAFYLFCNFNNMDSKIIAQKLLEEKFVSVVPGDDFGAEKFFRISYANSMENLKKAVERINQFVNENE